MIKKLFFYSFPGVFFRYIKSKFYTRLYFMGEYEKMIQRINKGVFVREKLKETREDVRREYDKVNEDLGAFRLAFDNNEKKTPPDPDLKAKLPAAIEGKEKDIAQLKVQIDAIDKQIREEGGVEEVVDSYRALLPLIERLIRKNE